MQKIRFLLISTLVFSSAAAWAVTAPPKAPTLSMDSVQAVDLEATNARFIGAGGSDSNGGRTHDDRWATTGPASGLTAGTDVYLFAGYDQGPRAWRVNWGGSASDPVVLGCYYLDSANGSQATSCDSGSLAGSLEKPVLRGTYTSACRATIPSTCPVDVSNAIPSNKWNGLIDVSASHVTVQDLEVRDSSGPGIRHNADYQRSNLTVQRVKVVQTYGTGVWFNKAVENSQSILRDSYIELTALQKVDGRESNWPPAVSVTSNGQAVDARFERNFVRDSGGEGIAVLRASRVTIVDNIVANNRRPLIYLDNVSDVVVERNMLLGNGYLDGKDESFGVALGIAVEPYRSNFNSVRNIFRDNRVANTKGGISISVFTSSKYNNSDSNPAEEGYKVGLRAYGNVIFQDKGDFLVGNNLTVNNNIDFIEIVDNVFIGSTECRWPTVSETLVRIAGNSYSSVPSDSACLGSNYVVKDPGVVFNYRSVNADNIPVWSDFKTLLSP